MFVRNNKRFNLNAYLSGVWVDDAGIQHPGSLLKDSDFRAQHGILEIPDPVRGDDETEYTQELDIEPWVVITPKSVAQIQEAIVTKFTNSVQELLDRTAQHKGYDSILSAVSYAGYTNVFQAEATLFANWRSACWTTANQILTDVNNNARTVPTLDQFMAELPAPDPSIALPADPTPVQ